MTTRAQMTQNQMKSLRVTIVGTLVNDNNVASCAYTPHRQGCKTQHGQPHTTQVLSSRKTKQLWTELKQCHSADLRTLEPVQSTGLALAQEATSAKGPPPKRRHAMREATLPTLEEGKVKR